MSHPATSSLPIRTRLFRFLIAGIHLYWLILFFWLLFRGVSGDYINVVYGLSAFGLYLFIPNLLVVPLAWFARRRDLWLGVGLSALTWVWLFGSLFLPRTALAQAHTPTPVLRVMTYNLLGTVSGASNVIAVIRAANADVVGLQELNPETAAALQKELSTEYPYQLLDGQLGVSGSGLLSRYPLQAAGTLPGVWVGSPQVAILDWHGQSVHLINVHPPAGISGTTVREAASQTLVDFVQDHPTSPIIIMGDFNATHLHVSYRLLAERLQDAWLAAGEGLGHTWPGAPATSPLRFTKWLIRIDYIFHTPHLHTRAAELGQWDGQSDHRPVIADLTLEP